MITLNGTTVCIHHFPDGTQRLNIPAFLTPCGHFDIVWRYEGDEELVTLQYTVRHIRQITQPASKITLLLPYIPNARMDRVDNELGDVFTLKYFAEIINSLSFDAVYVLDAHSNVSLALINNVVKINVNPIIAWTYDRVIENEGKEKKPPIFVFPDDGAFKRYKGSVGFVESPDVMVGKKVREWSTGKITDFYLEPVTESLWNPDKISGRSAIIIDDIISYGGTMEHCVNALRKIYVENIYIYCSHLENSVLDADRGTLLPLLNDGTVKRLYSTNSLFTGKHPSICLYDIEGPIVDDKEV